MRSEAGVLLNQRKYVLELISEIGLSGSKTAVAPLETNKRLTTVEYDEKMKTENDKPLQMYVLMRCPKLSHWEAAARVMRYLKGAPGQGILLRSRPARELTCWCDSDWAACLNTRRLPRGVPQKLNIGAWRLVWQKPLGCWATDMEDWMDFPPGWCVQLVAALRVPLALSDLTCPFGMLDKSSYKEGHHELLDADDLMFD
uniref:Uncharacterized mitochondrial protein AtMg00810-like n=1 Tax=Nicotiana tabacum TaxID=4097 RepID=A0A1S4C493_TOBAC|nr:PREDICTED: uncharacterized mitochondrial protein AtMg00810-like [Nicotiana tabacum]